MRYGQGPGSWGKVRVRGQGVRSEAMVIGVKVMGSGDGGGHGVWGTVRSQGHRVKGSGAGVNRDESPCSSDIMTNSRLIEHHVITV